MLGGAGADAALAEGGVARVVGKEIVEIGQYFVITNSLMSNSIKIS